MAASRRQALILIASVLAFGYAGARPIDSVAAAPETEIISGPTEPTRGRDVAFVLSGGASYECAIDGGAFAPCSSRFELDEFLVDGPHSFSARAIDGSGNADPTPAAASFTIDSTAKGERLTGREVQSFDGRLSVELRVGLDERGSVGITARARTRPYQPASTGARNAKAKKVRVKLGPGSRLVRISAGPAADRAFAAALERNRQPLYLEIHARFEDAAGNSAGKSAYVRLKSPEP